MKLKSVQVRMFRNILDSTEVEVGPEVTCLVGKNESGKTAFLEALRRLNPAQGSPEFDVLKHYPAWREKIDRRKGDIERVTPVTATFELENADKAAVKAEFGSGALRSETLRVEKHYDGSRYFIFDFDEASAASFLWESIGASSDTKAAHQPKSVADFQSAIAAVRESEGGGEIAASIDAVLKAALRGRETFKLAAINILDPLVPRFFYYSNYSTLPGIVKIKDLLSANIDNLNENDRTARALLMQAGAEGDYLLNPDYQTRVRELENVANSITQDILKFWSTNDNLRVKFDITQRTESRPDGKHSVIDELHIRMDDSKHFLSLPFDERSSGFQWFFSFLSAFSEYQYSDDPIVILLDEPGVSLHAKAQKDFLRFINERLAKRCQVIYTTHSPFMVEPQSLDRTRIVEDKGADVGAVVSANVFSVDEDSLFPLQGALGYDLAQHLFISPHNLVVEGTSDFTYLSMISDFLLAQKRTGLDDRWTIVPVGGADLVPTFVALLGAHLDVTVLVDARKEGHQKLNALTQQKLLQDKRLITVGDVLSSVAADIEDLFSPEDYIRIYNGAFKKKLKATQLTGSDPVVKKIARLEGVDRFDHGKPAGWLLMNRDTELAALSEASLDNFEKLFVAVNATLR